jgi:ribosome-binding factor A
MTSKKSYRRSAPPPCAEICDEDGVDPREFARQGGGDRRAGRKTLQLCSQVRDTLNYLLGDSADEVLALFQASEVRPAPDASQLLVMVSPAVQLAAPLDPNEVHGRLAAASGRLRAGVAEAITRKRAPKLLFHVSVTPETG